MVGGLLFLSGTRADAAATKAAATNAAAANATAASGLLLRVAGCDHDMCNNESTTRVSEDVGRQPRRWSQER